MDVDADVLLFASFTVVTGAGNPYPQKQTSCRASWGSFIGLRFHSFTVAPPL